MLALWLGHRAKAPDPEIAPPVCRFLRYYRCLIGKNLVTTARPGPVVSAGGLADAYLRFALVAVLLAGGLRLQRPDPHAVSAKAMSRRRDGRHVWGVGFRIAAGTMLEQSGRN